MFRIDTGGYMAVTSYTRFSTMVKKWRAYVMMCLHACVRA